MLALPQEPRCPLGETFVDARGVIVNVLELADPSLSIHGVALITSKAGTERSNHYHRGDFHWLYVLSGEAHYQERGVGESQYPPPGVFKAGEMFFTPAMREHRVFFPVDTVLLSMSRYSRRHVEHEGDVVRVDK